MTTQDKQQKLKKNKDFEAEVGLSMEVGVKMVMMAEGGGGGGGGGGGVMMATMFNMLKSL